ncbi:hypothetical protein [Streptomyces sp. SID8352]|uniref:hypothetical protein n=1 Tax=Streptomyces sp. SID8352 TaxID=2690338 RepID=UPI001368F27B|nr:hypothetical protein [Streptomyces sp. SID8352]MYU24613.1 hypothetical protein [Streptomyces sp. SID8352]
MNVHKISRLERPHRNDSTGTLKTALARTSVDAKRYAQTGPKKFEDYCHCHLLADEYLDELRLRGEL